MARAWLPLLIVLPCACDGALPVPDAGNAKDASMIRDASLVCETDAECDDGLFCTGVEVCVEGRCERTPVVCDDGIECTIDSCSELRRRCESAPPDLDGDGFGDASCLDEGGDPIGTDCDDDDDDRFPGNRELCDPEGHDEDCRPDTYGFQDLDSDGYVDAACCNAQPDGSLLCGGDCNDMRAISHPGHAEICDGIDNDCDGMVDEGALRTFYPDADSDGFGDASAAPVTGCTPPAGHVENAGDCDDANPYAHSATAPEVCDDFDNDCDSTVDEDTSAVLWYRDDDMDLFGDAHDPSPVLSCLPVARRSTTGGDCDDTLPSVHPTAAEVCNEVDDDCDGNIDEGVGTTYYRDADGDGQGAAATTVIACSAPAGYVARGDDCDDTRATTYVGAIERCDGLDNDCSSGGGRVDEEDYDSDGHAAPTAACTGGLPKDDCDDDNSNVYPGAFPYHPEPIRCGHGTDGSDRYVWCPARRCCIRSMDTCSSGATCDAASTPDWDYDCSGSADPEPWVTGSCERHPRNLGECIGEGPVGSGTPPACGSSITFRTCTRSGLTGPCSGSTSNRPLACR